MPKSGHRKWSYRAVLRIMDPVKTKSLGWLVGKLAARCQHKIATVNLHTRIVLPKKKKILISSAVLDARLTGCCKHRTARYIKQKRNCVQRNSTNPWHFTVLASPLIPNPILTSPTLHSSELVSSHKFTSGDPIDHGQQSTCIPQPQLCS